MATLEKLLTRRGLVYIDCNSPGYLRKRSGKRFIYLNCRKKPIRDLRVTARIESLVIPPQWKKVWICPDAKGHIQVTGLDQKSRKQYIYHPKWLSLREQDKFKQLAGFGRALPQVRAAITKDLKAADLSLQKVCAIALRIMDLTAIRPGNSQYTKLHGSFGLTTLRKRHIAINAGVISIAFVGKKGVQQKKVISSKMLAGKLEALLQTPGKRVFQYINAAGERCNLKASDLNAYLKDASGLEVTCKTFRTWNACHHFLAAFCLLAEPTTLSGRRENLQHALQEVATLLGNSKLISRKHYVSPVLIDQYESGALDSWLRKVASLNPKEQHEVIASKLVRLVK